MPTDDVKKEALTPPAPSVSAPPKDAPPPGDAGLSTGNVLSPNGDRAAYTGPGAGLAMHQDNMTFGEMGSSGLRYFAGWPYEEFLPQLQGRQATQKYREMQDNSPIIGGLLFAIQATLRKVEWRVEPSDDSAKAQEMADFVESCMHDMSHSWEDLISENCSMLAYGFAPHELVYKRRLGRNPGEQNGKELPGSEFDDRLIGWRRIPLRGQDTVIKWFFSEEGAIKGYTQQPWVGGMIDIPIEKSLLFRPSAHKNNPQGRSILRTAYIPYYFVKRLMEQEAVLGERMGGIPEFTVPSTLIAAAAAGNSDAVAQMNNFKKMAVNIRIDEQMGLVLPSDVYPGANGPSSVRMFGFQLVTPQGGRGTAMNFGESITRYNEYILTSVMADFLTMGHSSRGANNLAETKVDMFYLACEGYLNSMGSVYNRYAIPRLWDLNALDRDYMPKIVPDLAQRTDLDVLSNYVLRMSQAGMPLFPNEDLQTYLADAAGLPDMVDEDALRAAGLTPEQLDTQDEMADATLENTKNPPQPAGGKPPVKKSNLERMILGSLARRVVRKAGPKFGIHTSRRTHSRHKHYA